MKFTFNITVNTETGEFSVTNTDTGEIKTNKIPKSTSKKELANTGEPELVLLDNKCMLTQSAIELLGVSPGDQIDIKYEKQGNLLVPVIGSNTNFGTKSGNKLSKSNTVSCRGKVNEELSKYGTKFKLKEHPSKPGIYFLTNENTVSDTNNEDIEFPDDTTEDDLMSLDLDDLADSIDFEL